MIPESSHFCLPNQFKALPLEIVKLRRRLGEVDKATGVAPAADAAPAAAPGDATPEAAEATPAEDDAAPPEGG